VAGPSDVATGVTRTENVERAVRRVISKWANVPDLAADKTALKTLDARTLQRCGTSLTNLLQAIWKCKGSLTKNHISECNSARELTDLMCTRIDGEALSSVSFSSGTHLVATDFDFMSNAASASPDQGLRYLEILIDTIPTDVKMAGPLSVFRYIHNECEFVADPTTVLLSMWSLQALPMDDFVANILQQYRRADSFRAGSFELLCQTSLVMKSLRSTFFQTDHTYMPCRQNSSSLLIIFAGGLQNYVSMGLGVRDLSSFISTALKTHSILYFADKNDLWHLELHDVLESIKRIHGIIEKYHFDIQHTKVMGVSRGGPVSLFMGKYARRIFLFDPNPLTPMEFMKLSAPTERNVLQSLVDALEGREVQLHCNSAEYAATSSELSAYVTLLQEHDTEMHPVTEYLGTEFTCNLLLE
jgi:hypothetical protein